MNRLALGTVQFGLPYGISNKLGQVTRIEAKKMLEIGIESGIDTLDTAINYGESESYLGEIGIQTFKVVTKLPAIPEDCIDVSCWMMSQMKASLARLAINQAYGVLLHHPDQLIGSRGDLIYRGLESLKEKGLIQKIGISIYSPNQIIALTSKFSFDIVQAPFNVVDQRFYTSGWMKRLKDSGIEIHTRSTFLQGLLLMPQVNIPIKFSPWNAIWKNWHRWLLNNNISAVQASLAFPLSFSEIDRVIVGADNVNQLKQILSAPNFALKDNHYNFSCEDENLINPMNWFKL